MGASSRTFLNCRMEQEYYNSLSIDIRDNIEIRYAEVDGIDYSKDELWQSLKKESNKAYLNLKNREYDIRHNFKK